MSHHGARLTPVTRQESVHVVEDARPEAESLRLFVAVELPEAARAEIARAVEGLRSLRLRGVGTVRPEGVHLTLKFLGGVPADRVAAIAGAVEAAAARVAPFALGLGDPGLFPDTGPPRVLWLAIGGELDGLRRLHEAVEAALEEVGFARERRAFTPHLTVARVREGTAAADRARAGRAHASFAVRGGVAIEVDRVSLMRSILRPEGAVYQRLSSALLGRGGVAQGPGRA